MKEEERGMRKDAKRRRRKEEIIRRKGEGRKGQK